MTDTTLLQTNARMPEAAAAEAESSVAFSSVLVGVDGSSTGRDAIALAERLRAPGGGLTLAHVVLVPAPSYGNFHSTPAGRDACAMLERERAATSVSADLTGMFARSVGPGLQQLSRDCRADLLVVGSRGRGAMGRLLRGDDTQDSLNRAACAVAVAPHGYAEGSRDIKAIGVAYNGSPESKTALAGARTLATRLGASLTALTVVWPTAALVWPPGRTPLGGAWAAMTFEAFEREVGERLSALTGVAGRVVVGPPGDELLAFADQVDLLVVGSRGHGPLRRRLFGSTSADLARRARVPVLVFPHGSRAQLTRQTQ